MATVLVCDKCGKTINKKPHIWHWLTPIYYLVEGDCRSFVLCKECGKELKKYLGNIGKKGYWDDDDDEDEEGVTYV